MKNEQQLMQDLLFKGFVETKDTVLGVDIVIRNINSEDQLTIEKEMSSLSGGNSFLIHTYQKKVLSFTLLSVGDTIFSNRDEVINWMGGQSSTMVNLLVKKQTSLEKELAVMVGTIDKEKLEDFSDTPESIEG